MLNVKFNTQERTEAQKRKKNGGKDGNVLHKLVNNAVMVKLWKKLEIYSMQDL